MTDPGNTKKTNWFHLRIAPGLRAYFRGVARHREESEAAILREALRFFQAHHDEKGELKKDRPDHHSSVLPFTSGFAELASTLRAWIVQMITVVTSFILAFCQTTTPEKTVTSAVAMTSVATPALASAVEDVCVTDDLVVWRTPAPTSKPKPKPTAKRPRAAQTSSLTTKIFKSVSVFPRRAIRTLGHLVRRDSL